jgi:hypothetical protein
MTRTERCHYRGYEIALQLLAPPPYALARRSGEPLKMLIGLEGAHVFCVNIFGGVEHLRARGWKLVTLSPVS